MELNWNSWNRMWEALTKADAKTADVLAEHRFTNPAVGAPNSEHCFCGWVGGDHAEHVEQQVAFFCRPKPSPVKRPVTRKRTTK